MDRIGAVHQCPLAGARVLACRRHGSEYL